MRRRDARVLLADGDPLARVAVHHALRALGVRLIDETADAVSTLEALSTTHYELLISSWHLPQLGGLDLLWLVRSTPGLSTLPVIIADDVTPALVQEAAEAGVSAFLPRPCQLGPLEEVLRVFVGHQQVEAASREAVRSYMS